MICKLCGDGLFNHEICELDLTVDTGVTGCVDKPYSVKECKDGFFLLTHRGTRSELQWILVLHKPVLPVVFWHEELAFWKHLRRAFKIQVSERDE